MISVEDIELLESVLKDLRVSRGSDYSGVIALEKVIRELSFFPVNINEYIKVKLTTYGLEVYRDYIDLETPKSLLEKYPSFYYAHIMPKIDEKGYYKFQLWEFMNIFGEYFHNGAMKHVIDPLNIYILNTGR